jgi:nitrite reductase/ring-hydroxylating ferredoxin subunit
MRMLQPQPFLAIILSFLVLVAIMSGRWWVVSKTSFPREGERIHVNLEGRFITIFRHHGILSSIDSICHHAGGPLTLGKIIDIEDLGMSVISCPWYEILPMSNK